jgi:hypothetical protein
LRTTHHRGTESTEVLFISANRETAIGQNKLSPSGGWRTSYRTHVFGFALQVTAADPSSAVALLRRVECSWKLFICRYPPRLSGSRWRAGLPANEKIFSLCPLWLCGEGYFLTFFPGAGGRMLSLYPLLIRKKARHRVL